MICGGGHVSSRREANKIQKNKVLIRIANGTNHDWTHMGACFLVASEHSYHEEAKSQFGEIIEPIN